MRSQDHPLVGLVAFGIPVAALLYLVYTTLTAFGG